MGGLTVGSSSNGGVAAVAVLELLLRRYRFLAASSIAGALLGVASTLFVPKYYEVESILGPVDKSAITVGVGGMAGQLQRLGGLAIGTGTETHVALGLLASRGLCRRFAVRTHLLAELFPAESVRKPWDRWIKSTPPTVDDACRVLHEDILSIDLNELTGLVTVTGRWTDSEKAAFWINTLVQMANSELQAAAVQESQRTLVALQQQLDGQSSVEIARAIYALMEQQLGRVAAASSMPQFALTVIDPAEKKDWSDYDFPSRRLFAAAGFVIGGGIGVLVIVVLAIRREEHVRTQR